MSGTTKAPRRIRRRKFIRADLQLKVIFIALFTAATVLLVNYQLTLLGFLEITERISATQSVNQLFRIIQETTISKFLMSVYIAVPIAAIVAVLYSFAFAGPIYKFKKYFTDLRDGRWDEPLTLRKRDDLRDVGEAMNNALVRFRERIREDQATLQEMKAFLNNAVFTTDDSSQQLLGEIQARIEASEASFAKRFPVTVGEPSTAGDSVNDRSSASDDTLVVSPVELGADDLGFGKDAPDPAAELEAQSESSVDDTQVVDVQAADTQAADTQVADTQAADTQGAQERVAEDADDEDVSRS
jgi:hypothetical protein